MEYKLINHDEFIIIRHGRSVHNAQQTKNLNSSLTDWGWKQAINVGKFLEKEVDLSGFTFFTSPFERCLQTCDGLNMSFDKQKVFTICTELREYINHDGESVDVFKDSDRKNFHWGEFPLKISYEQETNEQLFNRVSNFCHKIKPLGGSATKAVIVTHGLPLMTLTHFITEKTQMIPIWDHSIDNCSITRIQNGRILWKGRNLHHELM